MRIEFFLIAIVLLFILGIFLVPWIIKTYNRLVMGRNRVREVWANIEVQLNRRHELIPNIVSAVKGYAKHEESVFTQVTQARSDAVAAKTPTQHAQKEAALGLGLASLYAVAEGYPELKASTNFTKLQTELSNLEELIQESRTKYNAVVRRFNTFIQTFPNNLISGILGFKSEEYYDAPDAADKVKVDI